ncbi:MAG: hypothetical protein DWQ45_09345 [Planctomycetota bacterium]|nr:MAG: hypothetical protein DWQ41_07290 [Planctomycetota bacterium]REK36802.1 MAG: hypothetical protein DWQ45_09345 [Planctomycetota bacterium]
MNLKTRFQRQHFANGYELVDGVSMHQTHGDRFQIPHPALKAHLQPGEFVELRLDSPRFSVHEDAPVQCTCPDCNEQTSKPILRHEQPASLASIPPQAVPSRGWGEDFWVRITERDGDLFQAVVDNPLVEARLHELREGDEVCFHENHILAVHPLHRRNLVSRMTPAEVKDLAEWLASQRG